MPYSTELLTPDQPQRRNPRILWANTYCLLDTSSGASMAVREMLKRLAADHHDVRILGATIFDAPSGVNGLQGYATTLNERSGSLMHISDGALNHELVLTADTRRNAMTSSEQESWYSAFLRTLDEFRPDLVYFYGGQALEMLLTAEARARGIPCVAYLVNGNYRDFRWCHDVSLILTDSHATASRYHQRWNIPLTAVGAFIEPAGVVAPIREPRHILAINPSLSKGGALVARIAMLMEKKRPDIIFEIVESRGNWRNIVHHMSTRLGQPRETLDNVIVTPNTCDMKPVYGRARLLLTLSLWWESFARVVIEALYNGIPPIITACGGLPEAAGNAAFRIQLPELCHQPPYNRIPESGALRPLLTYIERCHDDPVYYEQLVQKARLQGQKHRPGTSYQRFISAIAPLLAQRAGDHQDSQETA